MPAKRTCECGECKKCKHRAYMNEYYRREPQKIRDIARASRARRIDKVRIYDLTRPRNTDPKKAAAGNAVRHAVAAGKMVRGDCVVGTDCVGRIEGHHEDYDKPLDVIWLCQKHHMERHRRVAA